MAHKKLKIAPIGDNFNERLVLVYRSAEASEHLDGPLSERMRLVGCTFQLFTRWALPMESW